MADDHSQPPSTKDRNEQPDEARSYLDGLTFEETFHVGQSLGPVLERLDTQANRFADLKTALKETDAKVSSSSGNSDSSRRRGGSVCSRSVSCWPS